MKATKLPSGNWRVQPSFTDSKGKLHRTSITHKSKEIALARAYAWKNEYDTNEDLTPFSEALSAHIDMLTPVRSPATIRGYRNIEKQLKLQHKAFMATPLCKMDKTTCQNLVNALVACGNGPKTVRNYWGLVSSVLSENEVNLGKIALPEKAVKEIVIPTEAEIKLIIDEVRDTILEIPVLLASSRGLRRGEICALKWEDIDFKKSVIHVQRNIVMGEDKKWYVKTPKTRAGNRYVPMPKDTMKRIKEIGELPELTPRELSLRFTHLMERMKMKYHFHTLRHFAASYLHSISIPDAYVMQWLGWENDAVLKRIYRHALSDQEKYFSEIADKANFVS